MTTPAMDDSRLRAGLRQALGAAEPADVPAFAHVWARASARGPSRARWLPGALASAAALGLAAAVAWLLLARTPADADADYRRAAALVAEHGFDAPTDRWLAAAPAAPLHGLPELPAVNYPLLPEESFL